jgi:ER membrane protein complex subunit 1
LSIFPIFAVATADGSLHYLSGGEIVTMEESVTDPSASLILDPPTAFTFEDDKSSRDILAHYNIFAVYFNRWKKHLKDFINGKDLSLVDHGLRKYVYVGNSRGKVVVFDTFGKQIWQRYFEDLDIKEFFELNDGRTKNPPIIAVVGLKGDNTVTYILDATNGNTIKYKTFPEKATIASTLDIPNNIANKSLVFIFGKGIAFYPPVPAVQSQISPFYFYLEGPGDKSLTGYHITESNSILEAKPSWKLNLPNDELIVAISKENRGPVASLGRVLGNRSVLYKYLNPNLVAILTKRIHESKATLFTYLLDTITGKVHYKLAHYGVGESNNEIHILKTENLIIYTFWNAGPAQFDKTLFPVKTKSAEKKKMPVTNSKHYEIVVLELYEAQLPTQESQK